MATIIVLGILGAGAAALVNYQPNATAPEGLALMQYQDDKLKDFEMTGIVYGSIKPTDLTVASLNEVYKPYSAPDQTPIRGVEALFRNYARVTGYEKSNAVPFFFSNSYQISQSTSQQGNPNITQSTSWAQNKGMDTLQYFPRAYYEYNNEDLYNATQQNRYTTYGVNGDAGMPTETDTVHIMPDAGAVNRANNPYGPGGFLQTLFNTGLAAKTGQQGANLATIMGPPRT